MKHLSWKYIAGLVDGEGCIDVQTHDGYVRPRLRIGMSAIAAHLIENLRANHGGYVSERKSTNPNWSDSVCWELCGFRQVCPLLRNIANHLILKKEQARLCLWAETNLKGRHVTDEERRLFQDELKAMKRDPHRLSEEAQERILSAIAGAPL